MALFLYRLLIFAAEGLLRLLALFHRRAAALLEARRDSLGALKHAVIPKDCEVWWVHCASLGEFEQARPVMQELKRRNDKVFIALSFFSPSGYFPSKNTGDADLVFCLPPDTHANNRRVLNVLNPHGVIWVKYDFWFGYLRALQLRQTPCYLIAAVFRKGHFLFRFPGMLFLPLLKQFRNIFTQDEASALLLKNHGFNAVECAGDTRFDRVLQLREGAAPLPMAEVFRQESLLVIAGSSWPAEEALLHQFITRYGMNDWKLLLVPHDVSGTHINALLAQFAAFGAKRWSEFEMADPGLHVLVVDSIGLLARLYRHAQVAFVGGGYKGALHNILEAAAFGMPVLFGPETDKHWEAQAAVEAGCGFKVGDAQVFSATLADLLENEHVREKAGQAAVEFVRGHAGATQMIAKALR